VISLLALLFSLTGVLLTSQVLGFLRPTEFKPEDVVFWVIDGGSASTNYAEESPERDVAMIHGIWSTRWGAVFVLFSIFLQQSSSLYGGNKVLALEVPGQWPLFFGYVGILPAVFLFSCLLAYLVSQRIKNKAEKKHEEKAEKIPYHKLCLN